MARLCGACRGPVGLILSPHLNDRARSMKRLRWCNKFRGSMDFRSSSPPQGGDNAHVPSRRVDGAGAYYVTDRPVKQSSYTLSNIGTHCQVSPTLHILSCGILFHTTETTFMTMANMATIILEHLMPLVCCLCGRRCHCRHRASLVNI